MYLPQKLKQNKSKILILIILLFILSATIFSQANSVKFISYSVKKGDNLWTISQKYNVSVKIILSFNNIKDKDVLSLGQIIKIPQDNLQTTNYFIHTVKKGESLWLIAQQYNLTVNSIMIANNIVGNSELISIGQQIKIPSSGNSVISKKSITNQITDNKNINNNQVKRTNYYVVKAGDNLWNIAQKYGVSVKVIADINNTKNEDTLSIGQRLKIPGIGGGITDSNKKQEPTIITYTIVKGDTLWTIAKRYDVKMTSIISANNLKEVSRLSIGKKLKIPITNMDIAKVEGNNKKVEAKEIIYYVKKGESLWSISREYNVKIEAIIAANSITNASKISAGQELRIPNISGARSSICNFIWPVRGRVTSPFGPRVLNGRKEFHTGIDIAGPVGTNIAAAENGRVDYSGYMRGYGNVIIISHNGGYSTVYAHCSVRLVKKGQYVKKGSIIAKIGMTGYTTGPHLHFEVRLSGKPRNPLLYLR